MKFAISLCIVAVIACASAAPQFIPGFGLSGSSAGANAQSQTINQGGGGFKPFGSGGFSGSAASANAASQSSNQGFGLSGSSSQASAQSQTFSQGGGHGGLSGAASGANAQSQTFSG